MQDLKGELLRILEDLFEDYRKKGYSYDRIKWELDNIVYPHIGSYLSSGELKKEDGVEVFKFCEEKLREFKELENK